MRIAGAIPLVLLAFTCMAQQPPPSSPGHEYAPAFAELADHAGLIFTGTVVKVEFPRADAASDSVTVYFRVRDGVRGVHAEEVIAIREWKGLWQAGETPRYRQGEMFAMFCYPLNTAGVTSPVGGDRGRIHLQPDGSLAPRAMRLRGVKTVSYADIVKQLRKAAGR